MKSPVLSKMPWNTSLSELCKYLGVDYKTVQEAARGLYGADMKWHDARFDVCATYLCIDRATQAGMIRGLLPEG
jgi:hypothetical protein